MVDRQQQPFSIILFDIGAPFASTRPKYTPSMSIRSSSLLALVAAVFLLLALGCDSRPGLRARFELERLVGGSARTLEIAGVDPFDMFLDPDSLAITPLVLEKGIWEASETAVFLDSVAPGDVVVDIGANVGYYTLLASRRVGPEGRVYAFEPDPVSFGFLERNVRLNGFENVVLEQKAVSNENGKTMLFFDDAIREDSRIYKPTTGVLAKVLGRSLARKQVEVEMVRLDDYFEGVEERVDFIKMDTQGAEGVIIEGLLGLAGRSPGLSMIVEFVPALLKDFGSDPAQLIANLDGLGVDIKLLRPNRLIPVDAEQLKRQQSGDMLYIVRR